MDEISEVLLNSGNSLITKESCNYACINFNRYTGMLESLNNLLLTYSPKRVAFQSVVYEHTHCTILLGVLQKHGLSD